MGKIWPVISVSVSSYKEMIGDGSMSCRVTDVGTGASNWAKGGIMVRQSTDAGSMSALMPITPGDRRQWLLMAVASRQWGWDELHKQWDTRRGSPLFCQDRAYRRFLFRFVFF
ncbi:MAG: hypothetical protein GY809_06695 [Planctomycetes bacterium]|nr:hypothetical protein [Planctomycetota bacterium]